MREQQPRVAFVLEPEYCEKLETKCKELGLTRSEFMREAIKIILDEQETKQEEDNNV